MDGLSLGILKQRLDMASMQAFRINYWSNRKKQKPCFVERRKRRGNSRGACHQLKQPLLRFCVIYTKLELNRALPLPLSSLISTFVVSACTLEKGRALNTVLLAVPQLGNVARVSGELLQVDDAVNCSKLIIGLKLFPHSLIDNWLLWSSTAEVVYSPLLVSRFAQVLLL